MHHLMVFVVEANSKKEALDEANSQLNDLVEMSGYPYIDYGSFYEDAPVGAGHSVKNWGANKSASNLEEEEGRGWLMRNLLIDYQDFKRNISDVKKMLEEKKELEIYSESMSSYKFKCVDQKQWVCYDGEFVNFVELRSILDEKDAKDIWIVPCDVHT